MNSRMIWDRQEDKLIEDLVRKNGQKSWAHIAATLIKQFGTHRSGKQCRERWHNHLNPEIEKKAWSKKEEEKLFELHRVNGNKWTVIAESLPGRTDNSIKNYFYSTIRRSLRRISKFLGSKNSTQQMKDIKPSTLSKIFAAQSELSSQEFQSQEEKQLVQYIKAHSETVRASIVKFTNMKPKRNDKAMEQEKGELSEVIYKMIYINSIYEKLKDDEKIKKKDSQISKGKNSDQSIEDQSYQEGSQKQFEGKRKEFEENYQVEMKNQMQVNSIFKSRHSELSRVNHNQYRTFDMPSPKLPAPASKSDLNQTSGENDRLKDLFDYPQFLVELRDDELPLFRRGSNYSLQQSPGFPFPTPSSNPFNFFMSPSTPCSTIEATITSMPNLQNSTIDECQSMIQQQIETNTKGEGKKNTSATTIGTSPCSAFSFYFQ